MHGKCWQIKTTKRKLIIHHSIDQLSSNVCFLVKTNRPCILLLFFQENCACCFLEALALDNWKYSQWISFYIHHSNMDMNFFLLHLRMKILRSNFSYMSNLGHHNAHNKANHMFHTTLRSNYVKCLRWNCDLFAWFNIFL